MVARRTPNSEAVGSSPTSIGLFLMKFGREMMILRRFFHPFFFYGFSDTRSFLLSKLALKRVRWYPHVQS